MRIIVTTLGLLLLFFTMNAQHLLPENLSKHPVKNTTVNAIDYYYIEQGTGPTIFFLHGFPDLANTWDEAIDVLSKDYHCVAPFLRGYYPSGMAKDGNYTPKIIAEDIDLLAQKLGIETYYVVGQDWGASVAYSLMNLRPKNVIKGITIAIPHSTAIKVDFKTAYRARHFLKFANEKKSVVSTRKNNFRYLDVLYKRWSPGWTEYTETSNLIKQTFALEGRLEAALGYYWTFARNRKNNELSTFYNKIPQMPVLALVGEQDGALTLKHFYRMHDLMNDGFKLVVHKDAGHFLHREVPEFFIGELIEFLKAN